MISFQPDGLIQRFYHHSIAIVETFPSTVFLLRTPVWFERYRCLKWATWVGLYAGYYGRWTRSLRFSHFTPYDSLSKMLKIILFLFLLFSLGSTLKFCEFAIFTDFPGFLVNNARYRMLPNFLEVSTQFPFEWAIVHLLSTSSIGWRDAK